MDLALVGYKTTTIHELVFQLNPISNGSRCMPPRRRRRLGTSVNPINLSGFTPQVSLLGDPVSCPAGALVDSQYRSRRAKRWWRDAIRMMVRNLDPRIWFLNWKLALPRPPQLDVRDATFPGFNQWKATTLLDHHIFFERMKK